MKGVSIMRSFAEIQASVPAGSGAYERTLWIREELAKDREEAKRNNPPDRPLPQETQAAPQSHMTCMSRNRRIQSRDNNNNTYNKHDYYTYPKEQLILLVQELLTREKILMSNTLPAPLAKAANAIRKAVHACGVKEDGYTPIVQEQLAQVLCVTRRQVFRYLQQLQERELVELRPDPPRWPNGNCSTWVKLSVALETGDIPALELPMTNNGTEEQKDE
jgi:hypothetical protein